MKGQKLIFYIFKINKYPLSKLQKVSVSGRSYGDILKVTF